MNREGHPRKRRWKCPDPEPVENHLGEAPIRHGDSVIITKKEVDVLERTSAIRVEPRDERPLHLQLVE